MRSRSVINYKSQTRRNTKTKQMPECGGQVLIEAVLVVVLYKRDDGSKAEAVAPHRTYYEQ